MAIISTYNFNDLIRGNTAKKVTFVLTTGTAPNEVPIDLTGANIRMMLKKSPDDNQPAIEYDNDTVGGIVVPNPTNGTFEFTEKIVDIEPFTYCYDIQIMFNDGTVETWISGTWKIIQDVTREPITETTPEC
jgi:hypothetical protein